MWDRLIKPSSFTEHVPPHLSRAAQSFSCIITLQIHVALDKLLDFQVEDCQTCRDRECLCVEESKTFTWNVTATQLGVAGKMGAVVGNPKSEMRGSG